MEEIKVLASSFVFELPEGFDGDEIDALVLYTEHMKKAKENNGIVNFRNYNENLTKVRASNRILLDGIEYNLNDYMKYIRGHKKSLGIGKVMKLVRLDDEQQYTLTIEGVEHEC